jgi:hypothetical protein
MNHVPPRISYRISDPDAPPKAPGRPCPSKLLRAIKICHGDHRVHARRLMKHGTTHTKEEATDVDEECHTGAAAAAAE